jgi:pectinesterase
MMSMLKRIVLSIFMLTSVSNSILAQQQDTLVVSRDGTGKYRTIQEAVEAVCMKDLLEISCGLDIHKEKIRT